MNISTPYKRLKFYKKALWDYRKAKYLPFIFTGTAYITSAGFCKYITMVSPAYSGFMLWDFDELSAQKPKDGWMWGYWFPLGDLTPRIKCLKAAIKLVKSKMNKE